VVIDPGFNRPVDGESRQEKLDTGPVSLPRYEHRDDERDLRDHLDLSAHDSRDEDATVLDLLIDDQLAEREEDGNEPYPRLHDAERDERQKHQQLVREWIDDLAEVGDLVEAARDLAVEGIGERDKPEHYQC